MTHNKITSITRFQNFIFTYKIQLKISKINTFSRVRSTKRNNVSLNCICLFLVDTQIKGVAADEHFLMYYCRNKNSGVQDEVKNL